MRLLGWKHFIVLYAACLMWVVALGGCAEMDVTSNLTNNVPWFADPEPVVPNRVTAMWTPTILNQTGKPGVRGFGGRVFFHSVDDDLSVKVEGVLTVYAFEENGLDPGHTRPARKYVFLKEQIPDHYDKTKLGHSYSFWLPWDEVGGPPQRISLMARFDPSDGSSAVISESAAQVLPGIRIDLIENKSHTDAASRLLDAHTDITTGKVAAVKDVSAINKGWRVRARKSQIRTASHEEVDVVDSRPLYGNASREGGTQPDDATEKESMSIITIDVPTGFARRTFAAWNTPVEAEVVPEGFETNIIEVESTGIAGDGGGGAAVGFEQSIEPGTTGRQAAGDDSKTMGTERKTASRRRLPYISESRSHRGVVRGERTAGRLSFNAPRQVRFGRPQFPVRAGRVPRPAFGRGWREPFLEAGPSAEKQ